MLPGREGAVGRHRGNDETMAITSRDVARLAGVSQSTVSRVLQNRPEVSPEARAKVEAVLKEVGYAPNPHAQAMRNAPTNAIGVVVGRMTNPFYLDLLEAVSRALDAAGKRMILWRSDSGGGEEAAINGIRDRLADGLIFTAATYDSLALREALGRHAPIVLLNRSIDGIACDQLTSDNAHGTALAAQHIVALGHTRVAVLSGMQSVSTGRERRQGFVAEMQRLGRPVESHFDILCDFTHESGYGAAVEILRRSDRPSAIFCVNDLIALGVLDAARDLQIAVPQELSVVGYDDIRIASWSAYGLTTIRQPTKTMAEVGVEMLFARLADPNRPYESRRYSAELVIRGSTAAPTSAEPAPVPGRTSRVKP